MRMDFALCQNYWAFWSPVDGLCAPALSTGKRGGGGGISLAKPFSVGSSCPSSCLSSLVQSLHQACASCCLSSPGRFGFLISI